ncbi:unnamed protein product [Durusdinium trenchii]|uniref:Uncharacterized protein n=1 Tax=Durusdinium trenchii TaxID=1381693 RepID=A0ABP0QBE9_9DINO
MNRNHRACIRNQGKSAERTSLDPKGHQKGPTLILKFGLILIRFTKSNHPWSCHCMKLIVPHFVNSQNEPICHLRRLNLLALMCDAWRSPRFSFDQVCSFNFRR